MFSVMRLRKSEIYNYIFIFVGSLFMALAVVGFLSPNRIATGGTAGFAIVLHRVIDLPIGILMALINIPLIILGLKYLGKSFALKTVVCILSIVLCVDVLDKVIHLPNLSANLMLATLYGGVVIGVGLGLIFKGGASAGGGTILAKIISSKTQIKTSDVILVLDALVVISTGFVFNSMELALWSMISIYAASKLIDTILVGAPNQKIVHIASSVNLDALSKAISENLGVSGTIVVGHDFLATEKKDIIFIMIDKNKLNALKQLVVEYDPNVKMIVMEAVEVLGKESRV